ncbi:uncharacterized [Lates japonicus]
MDPSLKVPHRSFPITPPPPPPPNPPGLISCGARPTLAPFATEAGRERHPLTSSSIIRDGREPLWILSNSIQEFSQPVQSSLDKLTPCCVLFHNPPGATPPYRRSRRHTSSEKSRKRREK